MSKKMVALVVTVVFVLSGVGGWFLHSTLAGHGDVDTLNDSAGEGKRSTGQGKEKDSESIAEEILPQIEGQGYIFRAYTYMIIDSDGSYTIEPNSNYPDYSIVQDGNSGGQLTNFRKISDTEYEATLTDTYNPPEGMNDGEKLHIYLPGYDGSTLSDQAGIQLQTWRHDCVQADVGACDCYDNSFQEILVTVGEFDYLLTY